MYDSTPVHPPRASAGASVFFLFMCALAGMAGIAVSWGMLELVQKMESGAEVTLEHGLAMLATFGLQALLAAGLYLLTGLLFCTWMYKAVKFARSVAPQANRTAPGWVWLLVLPIIGHIVPALMAHAAYTSCHKASRGKTSQRGGSGAAVIIWAMLWGMMWLGWVGAQFVGQANPFVEGATAEAVRSFWYTHLGYQVVTVLAATAGAVMVMKVSGVQRSLASVELVDDSEELGPALLRSGLPGSGKEEAAPPLIPAAAARKEERPAASPPIAGLPGMPPPSTTPEEAVVRRAGLPKPPGAPAPSRPASTPPDEAPRQFMPGIPPPPGQSEAA